MKNRSHRMLEKEKSVSAHCARLGVGSRFYSICIFLSFFLIQPAYGQNKPYYLTIEKNGSIGNTADIVYCSKKISESSFKPGVYAADYVFTQSMEFSKTASTFNGKKVATLKDSLSRLEALLELINPGFAQSFSVFRKELLSNRPEGTHLWDAIPGKLRQPKKFQLFNNDQGLGDAAVLDFATIPDNCFEHRLAVIRKSFRVTGRELTVYAYSVSDVEALANTKIEKVKTGEAEDWLQPSLLFFHEWLWTFYNGELENIRVLRRMNRLLHSEWAEQVLRDEGTEKFHAYIHAVSKLNRAFVDRPNVNRRLASAKDPNNIAAKEPEKNSIDISRKFKMGERIPPSLPEELRQSLDGRFMRNGFFAVYQPHEDFELDKNFLLQLQSEVFNLTPDKKGTYLANWTSP